MNDDAPILVVSVVNANESIVRDHRNETVEQLSNDSWAVVNVVGTQRIPNRLDGEQSLLPRFVTNHLCNRALVVEFTEKLHAVDKLLIRVQKVLAHESEPASKRSDFGARDVDAKRPADEMNCVFSDDFDVAILAAQFCDVFAPGCRIQKHILLSGSADYYSFNDGKMVDVLDGVR